MKTMRKEEVISNAVGFFLMESRVCKGLHFMPNSATCQAFAEECGCADLMSVHFCLREQVYFIS
jgi:hypothetical protein